MHSTSVRCRGYGEVSRAQFRSLIAKGVSQSFFSLASSRTPAAVTHAGKHQTHFLFACVSSRAHHPSSPGRVSTSQQGPIYTSTSAAGYVAGRGTFPTARTQFFSSGLDEQPPVLQLAFRTQFLHHWL